MRTYGRWVAQPPHRAAIPTLGVQSKDGNDIDQATTYINQGIADEPSTGPRVRLEA